MSWQADSSAEVICSIAHHYYIRRGFDIIEVSDDTQFLDGNIDRLKEPRPDKLILRATACGRPKPTIENVDGRNIKRVEINNKFYNHNE